LFNPKKPKNMAKSSAKKANKNRMSMISSRAKQIQAKNPKKKWTDCIKAASNELKKEGKI